MDMDITIKEFKDKENLKKYISDIEDNIKFKISEKITIMVDFSRRKFDNNHF